jgi:hypothetical protein
MISIHSILSFIRVSRAAQARLPEFSDQQRGRIVDANKAQADQALPGQTVLT